MPGKILIAEDDKFLANAYRVKLEKSGFEAKIASDGVDFFTILEDFTPDVVLLDLVMPKKDGFAVLEELKDSKWAKIPVIVASNLGQKSDIEKAQQLGAKDYVVKSDESLENIVKKLEKYMSEGSDKTEKVEVTEKAA